MCLSFVWLCEIRWHAIIVDGHSVEELCKALSQARHQPTAIIAKTIKGKGIPGKNPQHCPLFNAQVQTIYKSLLFVWFQLLRIRSGGMPKLCLKTWLRWWWRTCKAVSWTATNTCTLLLPWRTPHPSAWGTSGCQAHPATRLEKRFDIISPGFLWHSKDTREESEDAGCHFQ